MDKSPAGQIKITGWTTTLQWRRATYFSDFGPWFWYLHKIVL